MLHALLNYRFQISDFRFGNPNVEADGRNSPIKAAGKHMEPHLVGGFFLFFSAKLAYRELGTARRL